ncbi:predicted protein [Arabidopsis lyrata subsp. lyrata]|uniref:Predicted protein n=1 Tax=Arabidopsis lyrata subsp. lyrata TaxID=81972 RepID=D7LNB5_ARALL|nr:predicted protein [Arabidopsis lyrata subsp. lyrata]
MEPWLEDGIMRIPWIKNPIIDLELFVRDLIDFARRDWDHLKLEEHFFPDDIVKIKKRKHVVDLDDFYIWKHNKNGDFSVKSAYWLACEINRVEINSLAEVQPSINILKAQKALSGALGVTDQLRHRGMKLDGRCQVCGKDGESINHVLFECSVARKIWAMSHYPSPENGFDKGAVFSNFHHLLVNRDNKSWPINIRKSFPWILWRIWKNKNLLFFEGKSFDARQSVMKIQEDVDEWFLAQRKDRMVDLNVDTLNSSLGGLIASAAQVHYLPDPLPIWKPPLSGRLKCNVGMSWSTRNNLACSAWVLRDEWGRVLLHSRRSFTNVTNKEQAVFLSVLWAMESLISHRCTKVLFALHDVSLIGLILRPIAWPSFKYESTELMRCLGLFLEWSVVHELPLANRGAYLLAQSVTAECRLNSYVASSYPSWLYGLFEHERLASSV